MHRRGAYGSRARSSRAYYLRIFYVPRRPTRSASVSRRRKFSESLLATLCTRSMLLLSPPSLLSSLSLSPCALFFFGEKIKAFLLCSVFDGDLLPTSDLGFLRFLLKVTAFPLNASLC